MEEGADSLGDGVRRGLLAAGVSLGPLPHTPVSWGVSKESLQSKGHAHNPCLRPVRACLLYVCGGLQRSGAL